MISKCSSRSPSDQWSRRYVHILVGSMIGKIRPSSWLEQWPRWAFQDLGCIKDLEVLPKSFLSCRSPILVQDPSCLGDLGRVSVQNLGWISELEDPSKVLVVSVISRIHPRSWLDHWPRRSIQDLCWDGNCEDPSKILVLSWIAESHTRSWFSRWCRGSVPELGQISDREDPPKILVGSVITKISP